MKKDLFQIINNIIDGMENVSISDNHYEDYFFKSGFSCSGVFIGFDFFSESDRHNYDKVIRAINKKRNLKIFFDNYGRCVVGIAILFKTDYETVHFIEESKKSAHDSFWEKDHSLRVSGVSDDERLKIMNDFHKENVRLFLESFQKIVKIA